MYNHHKLPGAASQPCNSHTTPKAQPLSQFSDLLSTSYSFAKRCFSALQQPQHTKESASVTLSDMFSCQALLLSPATAAAHPRLSLCHTFRHAQPCNSHSTPKAQPLSHMLSSVACWLHGCSTPCCSSYGFQLSASSHLMTMCTASAPAACRAVIIASLMCFGDFKRLALCQGVLCNFASAKLPLSYFTSLCKAAMKTGKAMAAKGFPSTDTQNLKLCCRSLA